MSRTYWIHIDGEERSLTAEQIRELLALRRIGPVTPVWRSETSEWKPLSEFGEFAAWIGPAPELPDTEVPAPDADQPLQGSELPSSDTGVTPPDTEVSSADADPSTRETDEPPSTPASAPAMRSAPDGPETGPSLPETRPWVRYWARQIDYILATVWAGLAIILVFPSLLETSELIIGLLIAFLWIPAEAAFLAAMGTTPGKWILATRVRTSSGAYLSFKEALKRSLSVWFFGAGIGVPLFALFTYLRGYYNLRTFGIATWDLGRFRIEHRRVGAPRVALAIAAILSPVGLFFVDQLFATRFKQEAVTEVAETRRLATEWAADMGASLAPTTSIATGELAHGKHQKLPVSLMGDRSVVIVGGCDTDCLDLDLVLLDLDGSELAEDIEPDPRPVVGFTTQRGGQYDLLVKMEECLAVVCHFGYQILLSDSELFLSEEPPAAGSCFAVHPDGLLLTAHHVVEGAEWIAATLADGRVAEAKVVHSVPESDLALLRIDQPTPAYLGLAPEKALAVGQEVFTMGFPATDLLGFEPKFTEGSITALTGFDGEEALFQISVPIQPGNSGGPVVDRHGEVVGIVTSTAAGEMFYFRTGSFPQNVNWAIKADLARPLFEQPAAQGPAGDRQDAIDRVRDAVCYIHTSLD